MNNLCKNWYNISIIVISLFAIIYRLIHLIYNPLYYGDELGLVENIKTLNFNTILRGLNYLQMAPPFFLIIEKTIYEIFRSNTSSYVLDLSLRIFLFICSIISIYVFYCFTQLVIESKGKRVIAFLLFTLNTQNIVYSHVFKQYSLELMVSVLLLFIAYKMIYVNLFKIRYVLIIVLSTWCSYSSIFITVPLMLYLLLKKPKNFFITFVPFVFSIVLQYIYSVRYILATTYNSMKDCWTLLDWGYLDFSHPTRIFIRFGEFFVFGPTTNGKILTILSGILIIYGILCFILGKSKYKIFFITPILLVILASILHIYPIVVRLILFLLPLLSVILACYDYKFKTCFLTLICLISTFAATYYLPNFNLSNTITQRNHIEYDKGYLNLHEP